MKKRGSDRPPSDASRSSSYSSSHSWRRFFSIANQLRYGLVLLVFLSLLPTGGMLIYLSFQAQLQQSRSLQQERSQTAAGQIDNYLDDLKRKLSYLARVKGLTDFQPQVQQNLLEGLTRHNDAYEAVAILNRQGQVVASVSPYAPLQLTNSADSPLFIRAFKQQEDYVSPIEIDPQTHQLTTILAVPIRNQQDQVDGVLLARVDLNFLWFVVSQTEVGQTGDVYVVDERKFLIAQKGRQSDTFQLQDLSDRPFFQALEAAEHSRQLNVYQGLNQVEVLGASALIRSVNWHIIVELPTAEAYAPVYQMLSVMAGALAVVTIGAIGIGFLSVRQIIVPLHRLTRAATELSAGKLQTRVNISGQNELGMLSIAFNNMADQLEGLIKTVEVERNFVTAILDIAGALVIVLDPQGRIVRFNRACEQISHCSLNQVKDRYIWDLLGEADLAQSSKTDFASLQIGHFPRQYEGIWLTPDQPPHLIAWSDTALLDDHGKIEYIIKTGIDITDRKQAEVALRQAKEEAETALQSLQQTQTQLIQAEKMSGLGQLVAGVAHEINNPVNFIYGNLRHTSEYTQDLLELIQLYQQTYPVSPAHLEEKIAAVDLDFIMADLPKMLNSMKVGADRIRQIVLSLRNFSRLDEAEMKPVDIHEGIDSTLLILQSRLKAKPDRPAIELIKDYGDLPLVECYAGQLNQVFMNILANAIDALEQYDDQRSATDLQTHPSCITIRTHVATDNTQPGQPQTVVVRIQDNGPGMTAQVRQRLFNPFFTTKPAGKGTGLGLSISYQIVVEKHGGSLQCCSQPGQGAAFKIEIPIRQNGTSALIAP